MISAQLEKTMRIIDRAANHPAFKTYRAVADYLGVSEGLISKIRKGKSNLQPEHVRQLAEAIGENVPAALLEEIGLQQETPRAQEAFSALARQIRGGGGVAAISDGYDLHLSDSRNPTNGRGRSRNFQRFAQITSPIPAATGPNYCVRR